MTCKEIIKKWLDDNSYDGLFHDDCGCSKDDLFPCGSCFDQCEPGYREDTPGGECDFIIGPKP